jgi:amino acid permease
VRAACVACFFGIAFLVPDVNDLATLVGGLTSPLLGFIFPPLFSLILFHKRLPWYEVALNLFLIVFGTFAMALTTAQQIQSMA